MGRPEFVRNPGLDAASSNVKRQLLTSETDGEATALEVLAMAQRRNFAGIASLGIIAGFNASPANTLGVHCDLARTENAPLTPTGRRANLLKGRLACA